ncbi:flavodoxin family protein [Jatrophihabitans sp.]|uniref:flavodoxin family protein n=1 Tax=Jatrophihabitans sp. TaxID=1932789 RepID=UPI002CE38913|nr:flavodoxin domain-containing protein [Jatrophihabitans sp.]
MRTLVVYESMYGNTQEIAEAVAAGLRTAGEARVLPVREAVLASLDGIDLLVVGGPTHAWGMTRARTRAQAITDGHRKGLRVTARPGDLGLREWLASQTGNGNGLASAAFDTRIKAPAAVTGRASRGMVRWLRRNGLVVLAPAVSFFVTRDSRLLAGETDRARRWGRELAERAGRREPSVKQAKQA